MTHRVEQIMGMPIVVEIRDEGDHETLLDESLFAAVFDWFRFVDETFSTYKPESEVSRIDRGDLALDDAHPDVREVLGRCEELRVQTDGYFDARYGGSLDPSGLVKGWAVDRAAAILDDAGIRSYAVNAGGDMRLRGGPWRVGIEHPLERRAVARVLEVGDTAVATSGTYARGGHVVDPVGGGAPDGVLSVTVVGDDLGTADAYATAAFAMGARRAPHWLARLRGFESLTILADGRVLSTPGFP